MNDIAGMTTSAPNGTLRAVMSARSAEVPELTATQYSRRESEAIWLSNSTTFGPCEIQFDSKLSRRAKKSSAPMSGRAQQTRMMLLPGVVIARGETADSRWQTALWPSLTRHGPDGKENLQALFESPRRCTGGDMSLHRAPGLRVVREVRFVSQHRARADRRRAPDVAAATDDRARDLRAGADARVRPDDRVLDARLLLDVDALAENGVDDLRSGLNGAVVGDHRELVNLGVRGGVERAAAVFQLDAAHAPGEHVVVDLQVARGRADVDPVGVRGDVRVELLAALEKVREQPVLERVVLARRDVVENFRVENVCPGVDVAAVRLFRLRLFEEASDVPVLFSLDDAVARRIFHGREDDCRRGLVVVVLADDALEVEVCDDVAVEDDGRLAYQIFGELVRARRAHRLRLDRVVDLDAELRAVAQLLLDLERLVRERERDVGDACAAERVNLVKEERAVADRDDRLRS